VDTPRGGGIGGAYGLYDGVRQTALGTMSGKLRRTQITNYTLKSGALVSNALGSIAVSYSVLYCLLSLGKELLIIMNTVNHMMLLQPMKIMMKRNLWCQEP